MGVEVPLRNALVDIAEGRPPSSGWDTEYVRSKAMNDKIREGGTLECPSSNWPPMYAAIALRQYLVGGVEEFAWSVEWWAQYFEEAKSGWWMHREPGSTIYRVWIREAVDVVHAITRDLIHSSAKSWLRAYWYAEALCSAPVTPINRYVDQGKAWVYPAVNLCGSRSWSIKNGTPHHIDMHISSPLLAKMINRDLSSAPEWLRHTKAWRIFKECGWSGMLHDPILRGLDAGDKDAAKKAVEHLRPYSPAVPMHLFRWDDGSAGCALGSTERLSGSTAMLGAMVTRADGERRVLYWDDGSRGRVTKADLHIFVGDDSGRVSVTAEREGAEDQQTISPDVDNRDQGLFDSGTVSQHMRRLVLHEGGSPLRWHVVMDRDGARMYGEDVKKPPAPDPVPTPPPQDPEHDLDDCLDEVRTLVAMERSQNRARGGVDHAAAITSLVLRALHDEATYDYEQILKHARRIVNP